MNKKLIALAVAAAFAAPAAMADVTVYGKVHMDIVATDTDGNTGDDNVEVTNNASRLGFKGVEQLGNGLKAIFKYEMTYAGINDDDDSTDDATSAVGGARNSYIGLSGNFGTFLVGRHDTPAKSALYAAGNEHLADSIIDMNRMGFTERRVPNAIAYISPNWSGLTLAAAVVPGEETGEDSTEDENGLMDSYSLGLMYKSGGIKLGLGYEVLGDQTDAAANNDQRTLQAGGSYTFDNITVGAQYSNDDDFNHTDGSERTTWALFGKYRFGANAIIAQYGNTETETGGATTNDDDHIGLAFQHNMSKRTSVYVAYKGVREDGANNDTDQVGVGIIHKF